MVLNLLSLLLFLWFPYVGNEPADATMLFVGDAMQHTPQINSAKQSDGSYDYTPCFRFLRSQIEAADYSVANLECPLGGKPYSGYPRFSAPDEFAVALKEVGFDLLQTANNHTMDKNDSGALRTITVLDSIGIPHVGTYKKSEEGDFNDVPHVANVGAYKVAFLAYTYGTNGIPVQSNTLQVNYINEEKMAADINVAKRMGVDFICVMLHWGIEYMNRENALQRDIAGFLLGEGVDIIVGTHPHVVQPMEMRFNLATGRNSLIIYSLGNFISNQNDTNSRGGALARVSLGVMNRALVIKDAECDLFFVQKPDKKEANYRLVPVASPELLGEESRTQYSGFLKNARNIFEKHNVNVPFVPLATDVASAVE
ncbi:MAG: CapA family protein [Muribaculaceae bacterium]|nr:CapA family protein [Muribaculaceae bacterium]